MKYLIVGLGNPGEKYENTRHNIGFKVVEAIAKEKDATFDTAKLGDVATVKWKGRTMILLKPNTYMNLSGKAVNYYMQSEKIDIENILVVVDDLALPFGKLRLRGKGSDGGHNGLKDIQEKLNSQNYARLRFGVGNEFSKGHQVDYVLGEWNEQEIKQMDDRIKVAVDIIKSFSTIGLNRTMSAWNNK
ncbi:MAG: aminoacyl-tRNA hydrolase [Brumimicrobium sp.]|nr:aminoacyl-tRNA hydrolase [Brumimicrobium sp.]